MKEYAAAICMGISIGLFLAFWFWDITQYINSFLAYTISGAVVFLVISAALFVWAWQTRTR
jgi:hypothetical protein